MANLRKLVGRSVVVALTAIASVGMRDALAEPFGPYNVLSVDGGITGASSVVGDGARDHVTRAGVWLASITGGHHNTDLRISLLSE